MSNNRMFLLHKPSCLGVMLAKVMSDSWYKPPEQDELQRFYDYVFTLHGNSGEFVLINETSLGWYYSSKFDNGFRVFNLTQ